MDIGTRTTRVCVWGGGGNKMKAVETNSDTTAPKFESGLTSLAMLDRGAERESSTILSTHPSSLGRPYTLSLPDDSSEAKPDAKPLRKDSTDSGPDSSSKDAWSIHQLETPESSVHHAPVTLCFPSAMSWTNSPVADSLASSIAKGGETFSF